MNAASPSTKVEFQADERARILAALESCRWNRVRAANVVGIPRRTFYRRLKQYSIAETPETSEGATFRILATHLRTLATQGVYADVREELAERFDVHAYIGAPITPEVVARVLESVADWMQEKG